MLLLRKQQFSINKYFHGLSMRPSNKRLALAKESVIFHDFCKLSAISCQQSVGSTHMYQNLAGMLEQTACIQEAVFSVPAGQCVLRASALKPEGLIHFSAKNYVSGCSYF